MDTYTQNVPQISVIMGICNCADTLPYAIDSILNQTVRDWELILCDDGSADATFQVAQTYAVRYPGQILLMKNERNMGLNHTLNRCLSQARGAYIARMDGDDLCHPSRFARELEVLEREPEVAIVSTAMTFFDETGEWGKICHSEYPQNRDFLHGSPFCHAPCMVRREAYLAVDGYTEEKRLLRVEDYHLWLKMYGAGYRGKNIQEPLYQMRDDRNAYGRRKFRYRLNEAYVRALVVKELKLPLWGYVYCLRPVLVGLLPRGVYDMLHKRKLHSQ